MAACELDLFSAIVDRGSADPETLAKALDLDGRGFSYLLAALASLDLLEIDDGKYRVPEALKPFLDSRSPRSVVPMIRHQANCARGWSQLAWTLKNGVPVPDVAGVNGALVEFQDFVLAMNVVANRLAPKIADSLRNVGLLDFERMLDLGGASGTYSFEFLAKNPNPSAKAVLFDRPAAIEEAKIKAKTALRGDSVEFYPGDFYVDPYPTDVDFVWISAIIHQQDDDATQTMFRKSFDALRPGGAIAVRDVYIRDDQTGPKAAAFFGLNMTVRTLKGKVYSARETISALEKAGFQNARLAIPADDMSAVVAAQKPAD